MSGEIVPSIVNFLKDGKLKLMGEFFPFFIKFKKIKLHMSKNISYILRENNIFVDIFTKMRVNGSDSHEPPLFLPLTLLVDALRIFFLRV